MVNNRRAVGVIQKIEILWRILILWMSDFEQLRLGQLINNAIYCDPRIFGDDIFYIEDYDLLDAIEYFKAQKIKEVRNER